MEFWPKLYDDETASLMAYTGTDKVITVPHIIAGYVTVDICRWAFYHFPQKDLYQYYGKPMYREPFIEEITLEEGYEALYHGAFYSLTSLKKLSLPSTMKAMYGNPFETCDNLKEIVFPNGNEYFTFSDGKLTENATGKVIFEVE